MKMRHQLIIIGAVMFATIAVAASVFAGVRTVAARQHQRAFTEIPIATTAGTDPAIATPMPDSTEREAIREPARDHRRNEPGPPSARENHGRVVSAFAAHIGFREGTDGPPGALVRTIARPNVQDDGPPRSDRAEENRHDTSDSPSSIHRRSGKGQSKKDR